MRKLIAIFLSFVVILCVLLISYDRKQKLYEILEENHNILQKLQKKSKRCCLWLEEFAKTFDDKHFITQKDLKKIVKILCKNYGVEILKLEFDGNIANFKMCADSDSKIIAFLRCLFDKELDLAIHPKEIKISKKEDMYKAILKVFVPAVNCKTYIPPKESLLQISKEHQNPMGLSLFNRSIVYEGGIKDSVIINGTWFPQNFEDRNFSLLIIDNSTIMLNVKKLIKTFRIKLGVEEIIAP